MNKMTRREFIKVAACTLGALGIGGAIARREPEEPTLVVCDDDHLPPTGGLLIPEEYVERLKRAWCTPRSRYSQVAFFGTPLVFSWGKGSSNRRIDNDRQAGT